MKKILCIVLSVMLSLLSISTVFATETANQLGDVDGNGKIEADDYILLKRLFFGMAKLGSDAKLRGDIDGNGELEADDYILLKRAFFGTYELGGETNKNESETDIPSGESGIWVWIPTLGGKKYHKSEGCSNMIDPRYVTLEEAEALGFTYCKRCYE